MASLFGKNKLRGLVDQLNIDDLQDKIEIARQWHHDLYFGSLIRDKETSREQAFNRDFFQLILGFNEKPATPYSLDRKPK